MLTDERIAGLLRTNSSEFRELEEHHHRLDAELAELQRRHPSGKLDDVFRKLTMEAA